MENQNKQRDVERELKELVQKYNVLDKSQLYAYFEKDGRERFVGRALKVLEKDRMIYVNNETKQVAANESAHTAWERGISTCLWVLIDLMNQKKIEQHFLASKEEYPIRIIFVGDGEIYDILYIAPEDIELTNQLFVRKKIDGCGHVVVVEEPESIPKIRIPDVIGYCTVKGDGEVEYYQKKASNQDIFQKVKKQLDEAQKMTSEVGELMAEARNILIAYSRCKTESGYENFTDMILESSKKGERLTEKLRRLSLEVVLDQVKYEQYQSELVAVHGIEMDYSDEILKIIMPVLIPHRKEHYTDYLYKPLYIAFKQWCICQNQEQKRIPEYEKCTVCFVHLYNRDLPLGRIRDHDNFEEKHVLDVISNFFLASDSGLHVDTYHITRMAEQDATEVYIMDTENFPKWLQKM